MSTPESVIARRIEDLTVALRRVVEEDPSGIRAVFLYGSALDALFRPDSDLDVAVLDDPAHPLSWSDQARLMDSLERITGRGVDLRLLRESSPSHQAHVIEHGKLVWRESPAEVERYTRAALDEARQAHQRAAAEWRAVLDRIAGTAAPR
jgi:predicted nucleotidyltransferase